MRLWTLGLLVLASWTTVLVAVPPDAGTKTTPPPPEAQDAAKRATVPEGLKVELWAAEPALSNPVAFTFDEQMRCYVVETNRFGDGVPDTRSFMHWLDDDLGARSVEDRLAMYKKHNYKGFEEFHDQIRLVWDSTGSGKADRSTIFAKGFNTLADGLGAGVLARNGDVYFTCIPALYRLRDTKNTGTADVKETLSTGYGIHVQFLGHDLHGLILGPDGKLYFSIGDRGFSVVTKEGKKLHNPDSGAVLRCNLDGSQLEIVHTGLRNPQELAFDDLGNLFTYDNNSDSGDRARWVHIVEGGDSGWRCGYQYGTLMHTNQVPQGNRGPWNTEQIWHVPGPNSQPPAYVVPALAHFGNGPSGLTFYPGVGLGDRYKNHFFAVDFTANPGNTIIWSLAVKPKGASFEIDDLHPFVKNMVATDCEFAPDGAFYWVDWIGGWSRPNKGRIFKVTDPKHGQNPAIEEARRALAAGLKSVPVETLVGYLEHPHRKLRFEAQYELAARGDSAQEALAKFEPKSLTGTLHQVWLRAQRGEFAELPKFFKHREADVRWNAVKAFRPAGPVNPTELSAVESLLGDSQARVQAEAARTFGRLVAKLPVEANPRSQAAIFGPLFNRLKANNNQDVYLRQALVEALIAATGDQAPCSLTNAWKAAGSEFNHPAVRLAVVLALRKMQCSQLDQWLQDPDAAVITEAARAIYDQELMRPMAGLAKLATERNLPEAVRFRAIAANYKLGGSAEAERVAAVAADASAPEHFRILAMKLLAEWHEPGRRDPINGVAQVLAPRSGPDAANAVRAQLVGLFRGNDAIRKEAVSLTTKLKITEVGSQMLSLVVDPQANLDTRTEALYTLEAVQAKELAKAVEELGKPGTPAELFTAARIVKAKQTPATVPALLISIFQNQSSQETIRSRQMALNAMGTWGESPEIDQTLVNALKELIAKKLPMELKLDVLEAAQARSNKNDLKRHAPIRETLTALDQADRAAVAMDPLARFRESIAGGNAARGKEIFLNNAAVYCQRCHKLDGQGGEVGPALNGIAKEKTRDYLLESIVNPNAQIAKGYESIIVTTIDGKTISGVLRNKTATTLTIVTADNVTLQVPIDDIDLQKPDKSAMPEDLYKKLSKREMRDLLEFLASLK